MNETDLEEESKEFWDDESEEAAEQALESLEERVEPDSMMADVDLRLETADYYRSILSHEFFALESAAAQTVHDEIRAFIRERLEVLLGIRGDNRTVKSPFNEEEVEALKLLAGKVLRKPGLVTPTTPTVEVKKMPTPASAPIPPRRGRPPKLNKVQPPPPAVSTKPKPKLPAPQPKPAPELPRRKPGRPPKMQSKLTGEEQTFTDHKGAEVTLREGEVIEEGIKRFVVKRNEEGTLYRQDITGQVAPANRLPALDAQQYALMSAQQAERQVAAFAESAGKAILGQ